MENIDYINKWICKFSFGVLCRPTPNGYPKKLIDEMELSSWEITGEDENEILDKVLRNTIMPLACVGLYKEGSEFTSAELRERIKEIKSNFIKYLNQ